VARHTWKFATPSPAIEDGTTTRTRTIMRAPPNGGSL